MAKLVILSLLTGFIIASAEIGSFSWFICQNYFLTLPRTFGTQAARLSPKTKIACNKACYIEVHYKDIMPITNSKY